MKSVYDRLRLMAALIAVVLLAGCQILPEERPALRGTGDLGLIIERASGSVLVVDTTEKAVLDRVEGLGNLSHASVVYSRDGRYGYVFGRDGGLTKVDLLTQTIERRIVQAGNSIGGAISQDGQYLAVSNYEPGGVRVFDSETLEQVADIPANYEGQDGETRQSKTVGLVDAPGNRFVFSLFDAGEIWVLDMKNSEPEVTRHEAGAQPYDALITGQGRWYVAGLFGEDGLSMVDLWNPEQGARHVLSDYGRDGERLPVYKMPHLEGWAIAGDRAFVPAVGGHEVLEVAMDSWDLAGRIPVHGQPVFVMASPTHRQIWVSFAHPNNDVVQVIDPQTSEIIRTLEPGEAVLHMEFSPRGETVWISARDSNRVTVYDTRTMEKITTLKAKKPSGIFFTSRAHRLGL
ncbi:cytochrome D1 domain-containing protein [Salicola sp. Rm-C-2C1-2]|uniref:cytochrome D1 domain-containing protein n=1 Tax=Salicola sp. Rm-C-2C1-2 TaxID=3141321 RepID=UPI0032E4D148